MKAMAYEICIMKIMKRKYERKRNKWRNNNVINVNNNENNNVEINEENNRKEEIWNVKI